MVWVCVVFDNFISVSSYLYKSPTYGERKETVKGEGKEKRGLCVWFVYVV